MVTPEKIGLLMDEARGNLELMKDLKNTNSAEYWFDKYLRFEDVIEQEFRELLARFPSWSIDLHCYKLYSATAALPVDGRNAKLFKDMAAAHRASIVNDLKEIEYLLSTGYDDFYGLGY